jgi:hypothetical protein
MITSKEEYQSLRQEIIDHQNRRLPTLSVALTLSTALIATGLQLSNPYLPLFALLVLHSARVQLVQIHAGIQRIAMYIRVVLEETNPELHWESGSYFIRSRSLEKRAPIRDISPLRPIDDLLFLSGIASVVVTLILSWPPSIPFYISAGISILWLALWFWYGRNRVDEWEKMRADDKEAAKWEDFKETALSAGKPHE